MDKRLKAVDPIAERALRDAFDRSIENNMLSLGEAIKAMRRLSRLTQEEFARHRGINLMTLKALEAGKRSPKVDTLNKVAAIFGLEVAFVRKTDSKKTIGAKG